MPVGANRRHKRQNEKAGETSSGSRVLEVSWIGRSFDGACGAALWLRQSLPPKSGRCRVSGWPHGITGHGHVARPRSSAAKGIKEVSGSPPLPLRGLRRHSLDICQLRGSAIRQGKCFATTRFRCLSVNAYPTIKKAATLSLNVSAQNIPTLVGKSIMLRDVHIYLQ